MIADRLQAALTGRCRVLRELGAGGMATVYLAQDLKHDRKVAIKVLRAELAQVLGADRFIQEIKTIAHLQHPNILPLFDSGLGYRRSVYGMIALAEGRPEEAVRELQAGLGLDPCKVCGLPDLGRAFAAAGQTDSAIATYERYLGTHATDKLDFDQQNLPDVLRQLGELYERKGDRVRALDYYGRFVELWRNSDPDLQPQVNEIRPRMAGLASQERAEGGSGR